jgi:hypothetical protein
MELLSKMTCNDKIRTILRKAGIISYERLYEILLNSYKLSRDSLFPSEESLIIDLVKHLCLVAKNGILICKNEIKSEDNNDKH